MKSPTISASKTTKIATWNVRTLFQTGKMAQVLREFENYQLDILGLTEVRWVGNGKIRNGHTTPLYFGTEELHERGVGLMLNREAANALIGWNPVSERILTARLQSRHSKTTIITVYAPTEEATEEEKDDFYLQCQDTLNTIPRSEIVLLIGDLNAKISNDRTGLEQVIGPHGSAQETNDNGERLLSLCSISGLCIGKTFFHHKTIHKKTWTSPDGKTQNEIDYICISRRWRSSLKDVSGCRGADVGSDHYLVRGHIQLKLKKVRKQKTTRPFAVEQLNSKSKSTEFQLQLKNKFEPLLQTDDYQEQWNMSKDAMICTAEEHIGRRRGKKSEMWIQDRTWKLIDERKEIKQDLQRADTPESFVRLKERYHLAYKAVKKSYRSDREEWFQQKGAEAQKQRTKMTPGCFTES